MRTFAMLAQLVSALLFAFLAGPSRVHAAYPNPGAVSGSIGVHDPAMVKVGSTYYLYATAPGISIKTSSDRTTFRDAGLVFPSGLPWCDAYTASDRNIWAPEVRLLNNQLYLWYSCSSFGSRHSAIFLATSPTGASGSWTHRGKVYETSASSGFNAIDPAVLVDGTRWWMTLGSFGQGIYQLALDPSTGLASGSGGGGSALTHLAQRGGDGSIEGATVFRHADYYYLFVAFDLCCKGAASTYRIMVGSSKSANGPFVDRAGTPMLNGGGTEILAGHGSVHGPGGQFVLSDVDGDLLVYHYYDDAGTATLGINKLQWSNGWPTVV